MASTPVVHDHFVLLLNTDEFNNLPAWLTQNFNIIEGGTHGGGSSRNKLIVFKDGTYLELFNWIKEPVEFLDWANKKPGLIDFAVTTLSPVTAEQNFKTVQRNLSQIPNSLNLGVNYQPPAAGARQRANGTEVKWKNSRPSFERNNATPDESYYPTTRTEVPFFCHDVTERTTRVPFENENITTHPCGATGIDCVHVVVPTTHVDAYVALYGAVLDVKEPEWMSDETTKQGAYLRIGVPLAIDDQPTYVVVHSTDSPQAFEHNGIGLCRLVLRRSTQAGVDELTQALDESYIGKSVTLRMGTS